MASNPRDLQGQVTASESEQDYRGPLNQLHIFTSLNPSVEISQAKITDKTVRAFAEREFWNNKEKFKEVLWKDPGQIHIQYDSWKCLREENLFSEGRETKADKIRGE
jgi:hypothetical protein